MLLLMRRVVAHIDVAAVFHQLLILTKYSATRRIKLTMLRKQVFSPVVFLETKRFIGSIPLPAVTLVKAFL